jgi:hypothetical protein
MVVAYLDDAVGAAGGRAEHLEHHDDAGDETLAIGNFVQVTRPSG